MIFLANGKNVLSVLKMQLLLSGFLDYFFASPGALVQVLCLHLLRRRCSVVFTVLASWHRASDTAVTQWAPIRVGENST